MHSFLQRPKIIIMHFLIGTHAYKRHYKWTFRLGAWPSLIPSPSLLQGIALERRGRCNGKYLMISVCYCCTAADWRQKRAPRHLWLSHSSWPADRKRVTTSKVRWQINQQNWSFSLFGFILFVGQSHNGSIKSAIKCNEGLWEISWLKLWQGSW